MRRLLALFLILAGLAVAVPASADVDAVAYGAFRIVRSVPGTPATPEIMLPEGYTFVAGSQYRVASRAEYYAFIQGPPSGVVPISVRWPGVDVGTVVSGKNRLIPTPDPNDPGLLGFTVPVTASTINALQPTLQVFSYPSASTESGMYWRIEHNDPDRAAGVWTQVRWPAAEARTFLNHQVAVAEVLRDAGLAAEAARRGHFYALMGFETNNTLHQDNPPHWHLSYYPGRDFSAPRAHVPHFWMDAAGRTFYNGMDIQGQGRSRYYAGDPAPIRDVEGSTLVTLTIRADGGLDIDPPAGPRYSLSTGAGFPTEVVVSRAGVPWLSVRANDDVRTGILVIRTTGLVPGAEFRQSTIYTYDPLTGAILGSTTKRD
ncbi:MAG TPA: hypothetical protein VFV67_08550 [Actinophytocola sp.]|uniref:hypothetical protein n=1 Tax=Actinophytocola sp. TaxID=1872138 RepID=UPI002DBAA5BB|nr:hypothetical protein [Actinophytocola sp.]HEU5470690.1 hypothetical protein [Actinophytocola sp.]